MSSHNEMMDAFMYAVVNTVAIIVYAYLGAPLWKYIMPVVNFEPMQPSMAIAGNWVSNLPTFFFYFLLACEFATVARFFYVVWSKGGYAEDAEF